MSTPYFITLGGLTLLATATLIVYNQSQQLREEQLDAARQLWRAKGPKSYYLDYSVKTSDGSGEPRTDHVEVTVRSGVVTAVTVNDRGERSERFGEYGMEKLFDLLAENLAHDREPGQPRTFTRYFFRAENGALASYVRRVMGSRQRVEITAQVDARP